MIHIDDETKKAIFGEAIVDELKVINEYLSQIPALKLRLAKNEDKLARNLMQLGVIKAVVTEHDKELKTHQTRITQLELAHS